MTDAQQTPLGATPLAETQTAFAVWAPCCRQVDVEIVRDGGILHDPLQPIGNGHFHGIIDDVGAGTRYAFRLDETLTRPDPCSRYQPQGVHGPSEVIDPAAWEWQDADWAGIPKSELIIYELHIGTFTAAGTFRAASERLDELCELGVTAIEIMPVAQTPGRWNWGYDGVNLFAVNHNYGTPDDFRALIDAAHAAGLGVILDVVYNHVGPEGNYLAEFGPYVSTTHHTPWGDAFNFDGADSAPVRRFIVENAVRWLDEYHLDGLRLDAVHCMHDDSDVHILSEIRAAVTEFAATVDRHIHLIAEANLYDDELLHPATDDREPYDAIWSDDIMHALYSHVLPEVKHTRRPYHGATDLTESLTYGVIYASPPERRIDAEERQRLQPDGPGDELASLVIALQNHDVIGNDPHGRRLHQLTSVDTQRAAAALILLYPAIPLLFMGEEFAADSPFRFFTDFEDEHLRQAVERGRSREYPEHQFAGTLSALDPRAFADAALPAGGDEQTRDWYRQLIRVRRQWQSEGCLTPAALSVDCDPQRGLFSLQYRHDRDQTRFVIARISRPGEQEPAIGINADAVICLDSRSPSARSESTVNGISLQPNHAVVGHGHVDRIA